MRKTTSDRESIREHAIRGRLNGETYATLSTIYGIPEATIGRWCRKVIDKLPAEIKRKTPLPHIRATDAEYDKKWMEKVRRNVTISESGCWLWQGNLTSNGYGQTDYRKKTKAVHRQLYKVLHGIPLSTKQFVCHHCDERRCCNPGHLFLGTQKDNMADSVRKGRHAEQLVTHCPRGHEYNKENTSVSVKPDGKTARGCKICQRARQRMKIGWPEDAAYSLPPQPLGYLVNPARREV